MHKHRVVNVAIVLCLAVPLLSGFGRSAQAEMYYDAAVKAIYEDNIVGVLSDKRSSTGMYSGMTSGVMGMGGGMGSKSNSNSDIALDFFAELGGAMTIGRGASVFLAGSAERISYSKFTELNATIGGLSTGIYESFGDVLAARVAVNGLIKRFGDSDRDSSTYGAAVALRERLNPSFWLKQSYLYERNNANAAYFTYKGHTFKILAGYSVLPKAAVLLGYSYLVKNYAEPSDFKVNANTVSLGLEYEFSGKLFIDALYERQASDSNVPGTNSIDNILSLGFRHSY